MKLLSKESILEFKNLNNINDGFRIPDEAYIHGKDFICFEEIGANLYFSNFWYGDKNTAIELLYIDCFDSELRELFTCVSEEAKEDFIQAAQENEINI